MRSLWPSRRDRHPDTGRGHASCANHDTRVAPGPSIPPPKVSATTEVEPGGGTKHRPRPSLGRRTTPEPSWSARTPAAHMGSDIRSSSGGGPDTGCGQGRRETQTSCGRARPEHPAARWVCDSQDRRGGGVPGATMPGAGNQTCLVAPGPSTGPGRSRYGNRGHCARVGLNTRRPFPLRQPKAEAAAGLTPGAARSSATTTGDPSRPAQAPTATMADRHPWTDVAVGPNTPPPKDRSRTEDGLAAGPDTGRGPSDGRNPRRGRRVRPEHPAAHRGSDTRTSTGGGDQTAGRRPR